MNTLDFFAFPAIMIVGMAFGLTLMYFFNKNEE